MNVYECEKAMAENGWTVRGRERHREFGFFISILFHILILLLPFSSVMVKSFNEVEIVIIEDGGIREKREAKIEKGIGRKEKSIKKEEVKSITIDKPQIEEKKEEVIKEKVVESKPLLEPALEIKEKKEEAIVSTAPANREEPKVASKSAVEVRDITMTTGNNEKGSENGIKTPTTNVGPVEREFGAPTGPKFLKRETPTYPIMARKLGKEGRVLLRLTIDRYGKLVNLEVLEDPGYGFAEAAIEAVKRSTFSPAIDNGRPVISKALLSIKFTLRGRD